LSENRRYREFMAQQKTELVLASPRGPESITELCREHEVSDSLLRKVARAVPRRRRRAAVGQGRADRDRRVAPAGQSARAGVGAHDAGGRDRGGTLAGPGVRVRVARSRELVAQGRLSGGGRSARGDQPPGPVPASEAPAGRRAASARSRRPSRARGCAREPTDGTRMVAALARGELGAQVNRKARAAADARAPVAAAPPQRGPPPAAGVLSASSAPTSFGSWT
jgi:transposase-like protein